MKTSEKIALESLIASAVITFIIYLGMDSLPWWVFAIIFVFGVSFWSTKRMASIANERRVDE